MSFCSASEYLNASWRIVHSVGRTSCRGICDWLLIISEFRGTSTHQSVHWRYRFISENKFKLHLQCIQHKVTYPLAPEVKLSDHMNLVHGLGMYGALPQHTPCHYLLCFDKGWLLLSPYFIFYWYCCVCVCVCVCVLPNDYVQCD
jgi:hypothetical protein